MSPKGQVPLLQSQHCQKFSVATPGTKPALLIEDIFWKPLTLPHFQRKWGTQMTLRGRCLQPKVHLTADQPACGTPAVCDTFCLQWGWVHLSLLPPQKPPPQPPCHWRQSDKRPAVWIYVQPQCQSSAPWCVSHLYPFLLRFSSL